MEKKGLRYTIHASAINRYANRIYTKCLHDFPIGSGQYFFLLRIYENDGISLYALAQMGFFDKGTVSRGVQKLEEAGYPCRPRRKGPAHPQAFRHGSGHAHYPTAAGGQRNVESGTDIRHE